MDHAARAPAVALSPADEALLRRELLRWAIDSSQSGETSWAIVDRAYGYFRFVTHPLRRDVAAAMVEREGAELH